VVTGCGGVTESFEDGVKFEDGREDIFGVFVVEGKVVEKFFGRFCFT